MTKPPHSNEHTDHAFDERKRDHIRLSLDPANQAGSAGFESVQLTHEALPDLNFNQVSLECESLGYSLKAPLFISSMTAGHAASSQINIRLAKACEQRGWRLGVGSQRKELFESAAVDEWRKVRLEAPNVQIMGNLGLAQVIQTPTDKIRFMVESLGAMAMIVHLNPLQECLQVEGTPEFAGGIQAINRLAKELEVPVVIKETGCGISPSSLHRLSETGIAAVDVSGYGGTHWGRIEGKRATQNDVRAHAALAFSDWGISTVECLANAADQSWPFELWASGGVRSGVDAAKALAMGARLVGIAKPVLEAALVSEETLNALMAQYEFELRTALFCTGLGSVSEFQGKKVWSWRKV